MRPFRSAVYVAGVARSGTSWVAQVFNSAPNVCFRFQPLFAYEFKGRVSEDSSAEELDLLLCEMFARDSEFLSQTDKTRSGEYPRFDKATDPDVLVFKENRYQSLIEPMLRKLPYLRLVGVVRNPCAVINSWRKNPKEFPPGSDLLQEWRFANCKNKGNEDYFGFYKWKEVAHMYLDLRDKYPDRVEVLQYEEAVESPQENFARVLENCGIAMHEQTERFIRKSTTDHGDSYYGVFKGRADSGQWRKELDPHIREEIEADLTGTRLERFLR